MGLSWKAAFTKKPFKLQLEIIEAKNNLLMKCESIEAPSDIYRISIRHCNKFCHKNRMPLIERRSEEITRFSPIRVFYYKDGDHKINVKDYKNWSYFEREWKFIDYGK